MKNLDPTDHTIPQVPNVNDTDTEENQFQDPVAAPSVTGEEDPFSGDATNSESPDIDAELAKVGLHGDDDDQAGSINVNQELDEEVT